MLGHHKLYAYHIFTSTYSKLPFLSLLNKILKSMQMLKL